MRIVSQELRIITSSMDELEELDAIYSEACGHYKFNGARPIVPPAVCMEEGDLPSGGRKENYELLSIYVSGVLVGYASVYRDFPGKRAVQISFFYISSASRDAGYDLSAARQLVGYFRDTGYAAMRVLVSLRSWTELDFWFSVGFDRIIDVRIDGELDEGATGIMALELRF